MVAVWARLGARFDRSRMRVAAWLLILLLGAAASLALPGATIFFLLAPALAIAGIAIETRSPLLATIVLLVAAILQLLMFAELLALIEMLLIDGPLWAVLPLAALAVLPLLVELEPARLRSAVALTAVAALGLATAAIAMRPTRCSRRRCAAPARSCETQARRDHRPGPSTYLPRQRRERNPATSAAVSSRVS